MTDHTIEEALLRLAKRHQGRLTPEMVVAEASRKGSPLHARFTWDDTEAAHRWRLSQARELIRSIKVEVTTTPFQVNPPMFVRDPARPGGEQGYVLLTKLRSEHENARDAVVREFAIAASHLARARAVASALGLSNEIGEIHDRVVGLSDRVSREGEAAGQA